MKPKDLAKLRVFRGVPLEELRLLCKRCKPTHFKPGEVALAQGAQADHALLLAAGALQVTTHEGGRDVVVATIRDVDIVGESAWYLFEQRRAVSLVAKNDVTCLKITRADLDALSGTQVLTAIQLQLLESTAQRLRQTQAAMRKVLRTAEAERVAAPVATPSAPPARGSAWRRFFDAFGGLA